MCNGKGEKKEHVVKEIKEKKIGGEKGSFI
jgi:hypothetical protein